MTTIYYKTSTSYISLDQTSKGQVFAYVVGDKGAVGSAGTTGSAGGLGGTGSIKITEYYQ